MKKVLLILVIPLILLITGCNNQKDKTEETIKELRNINNKKTTCKVQFDNLDNDLPAILKTNTYYSKDKWVYKQENSVQEHYDNLTDAIKAENDYKKVCDSVKNIKNRNCYISRDDTIVYYSNTYINDNNEKSDFWNYEQLIERNEKLNYECKEESAN